MYHSKFIWNCPRCKALNSYCPEPEPLSEIIQDFGVSASSTETGMKLTCHSCNDQYLAHFNSLLEITDISLILPAAEESHIYIAYITDSYYEEPIQNIINKGNLRAFKEVESTAGTYQVYLAHIQDDDEFNCSVRLYSSDNKDRYKITEAPLNIHIRNIYEYESIVMLITSTLRVNKIPYCITCNKIIHPGLFNKEDIVLNVCYSVDKQEVKIDHQFLPIGDSLPVDECIAYVSVAHNKKAFKDLLKIKSTTLQEKEEN